MPSYFNKSKFLVVFVFIFIFIILLFPSKTQAYTSPADCTVNRQCDPRQCDSSNDRYCTGFFPDGSPCTYHESCTTAGNPSCDCGGKTYGNFTYAKDTSCDFQNCTGILGPNGSSTTCHYCQTPLCNAGESDQNANSSCNVNPGCTASRTCQANGVWGPCSSSCPTCPVGQTINKVVYSCQSGSSCPSNSYYSGHTCSSGQTCCYTSTLDPNPKPCTPEKDVICNQTISSYDDNVLCPGTGTECVPPTNICTVDGCKPPANPCPAGEVIDGKFLYSCVAASSCPAGSNSAESKTCPSGKRCCYSLLVGPPKEKTEGWCSVFSAVSTGTNSATAEGDRYGFNRMDWYLSKNGATPIFHHTSNVAQTKASIEQFIDHSTTFNNLSPKTKYTVTAKGWCQTPECTRFSRNCLGAVSFTTDIPKPGSGTGSGPHPNLQCWGGYQLEFGQVARWVSGVGTGVKYTANFNLPGTSGYKPGEGCFRPGVSVSDPGPEDGTLGGRIYVVDSCTSIDSLVKNTAKLTQPADFGNILYWVWSTADNGGPMCMLNNGTYCQLQDGSLNYISSSNKLLGTITENNASPLYSGNSVSLISWDSTKFKPLGYYRYQHSVGKNCFEGPNGTECTQHACEPTPPEFFHWGGWLCDGCTGSPGWFSKPLVNNFYPNPDAPYCLSNDPSPANAIDNINPNARIDFIFERTGNSFTVSGYVYDDTNKNGTQDGGETTGIPDVTINLSGAGSTQTIQTNSSGHYSFTNVPSGNYSLSALTPEGYKLTTPESKDITVGCDGLPSQNFLARTSYYISGYVKNDVNFDGECSQDEPSFAGTVVLTNNIANRQPILLSGNGDYIFDDLPIPNLTAPNKTYTYKVTADIGITPTSGLPYQEILTLPPSKKNVNFCIQVSSPWVQTDGDVHSNTGINMPKGPKPKP